MSLTPLNQIFLFFLYNKINTSIYNFKKRFKPFFFNKLRKIFLFLNYYILIDVE